MKIKCSRRLFLSKSGFTLIELLVVVLIIGILAAVALPQYNKAVKKSQGAEALAALDALDKNLSAYYLEYGTYSGLKTDSFSIEVPRLNHFKYLIGTGNDANTCKTKEGTYEFTNANFTTVYASNGMIFVDLCSPDNKIVAHGMWVKGKGSFACWVNDSSFSGTCADANYFNCGTAYSSGGCAIGK